jgi:hypothetical protein
MDNSIMFIYNNEFHANRAINVEIAVQILLLPRGKYGFHSADFHETSLPTASDENCTKYEKNLFIALK